MSMWLLSTCFCFQIAFVWGCSRDYTSKCPVGWTVAAKQCQAPLSYRGPCATIANIEDGSDAMKQQFETKCSVTWPCVDMCPPDYGASCPQNWLDVGSGVCDAPLGDDHHCLKRTRMFNEEFKHGFATACSVHWPCKLNCQQDFRRACPADWSAFEGFCEAPDAYVGPCAPFANLNGLTEQDKTQYAALCQVAFPCQSQASAGLECAPTESPCPKGWDHKGSSVGVCHSMHYQGPCRPLITVEALTSIGKFEYMEMCGVEFGDCNLKILPSSPTIAPEGGQVMRSGPVDFDGKIIDSSVHM